MDLTPQQIEENFKDIKPPLSDDHAAVEANRCLYCYDAPCAVACPTHIDIPEFIRRIGTGNVQGAAETILDSNILGASCARVCPTEVLCEGSCVFLDLDAPAIDIGRLQRYATDYVMDNNIHVFEAPKEKSLGKVAIVGGGPAGLACAAELGRLGIQAVVYEEKEEAGGLNRYGIAPYKLTNEETQAEIKYIQEMTGFEIKTGMRVGRDVSFEELEKEYDFIFLGVGVSSSRLLQIDGEDKEGVVGATEWIEELRKKPLHQTKVGPRVIVVGAGNTAIDAATEAARLGAEQVSIVYRRGKDEMPAYEFEYELALKDKVDFHWFTQPIEVLGNGKVEGLKCRRMAAGEPDESGRPRPVEVPNSEFVIEADTVIKATGQVKHDFLSGIDKVILKWGLVEVDENYRTTNPKYYAGGDCVNGGKEVVNAVYHAKQAALAMHRELSKGGN